MPTVIPYELVRVFLLADADVVAQVGTHVYEGGLPDTIKGLAPVKSINMFMIEEGQPNYYIWLDSFGFQLECYGPTRDAAWEVHSAARIRLELQYNRRVTLPSGGTAWLGAMLCTTPGIDDFEGRMTWPTVTSRWLMRSWRVTHEA